MFGIDAFFFFFVLVVPTAIDLSVRDPWPVPKAELFSLGCGCGVESDSPRS